MKKLDNLNLYIVREARAGMIRLMEELQQPVHLRRTSTRNRHWLWQFGNLGKMNIAMKAFVIMRIIALNKKIFDMVPWDINPLHGYREDATNMVMVLRL